MEKRFIIITYENGIVPPESIIVNIGDQLSKILQCDNLKITVAEPVMLPKSPNTDVEEEAIQKVATYIHALVSTSDAPMVLAARLQKQVCENNSIAINAVNLIKNTHITNARIMQLGIPFERIVAIRTVTTE